MVDAQNVWKRPKVQDLPHCPCLVILLLQIVLTMVCVDFISFEFIEQKCFGFIFSLFDSILYSMHLL